MDALEILRQEHRTVLRVVRGVRRGSQPGHAPGDVDRERTAETIEFFRYFTNACHAPKEEDLLFTALHRHGLAWDEPPLCELVAQHRELRAALDSASDWLGLADDGFPGALEPLAHAMWLFMDLLERHITLEEQVLFPLALERLHPRDLDELADEFTAIACEERHEGLLQYYAGVARELAGAGV